MYDSKLFQLLSRLKGREMGNFLEFVQSPYFNKNERVSQLCAHIAAVFPDLAHASLERHAVYATLFPGEEFDTQRLYDHASYLLAHLKEFLTWNNLKSSSYLHDLHLLRALRERNAHPFFLRQMGKMERTLEKNPYRDERYFQDRFALASEGVLHFGETIKESQRTQDRSLQVKMDSLDRFYLAAQFKYGCEMINRQNIIGASYNLEGLKRAMAWYESMPEELEEVPAIAIYHRILKTLLESDNTEHYFRLKEMLAEGAAQFSSQEALAMYNYAQNYCIKQANSGNVEFLRELFGLYQLMLAESLILQDGRLSQWDYKNIVSVGIRLLEYDWTENFIRKYKDRLDPEVRENAFAYNLATWYHATGDCARALRLLQTVEFKDVFYHLGTKSTILKIYYEMEETEALFSHIGAFRSFLRRSRLISAYQRKIYQNLLRLTQRLYRLRLGKKEPEALSKLKEQVVSTRGVANVSWLLEKLDELEKEWK